MRWIAQRVAHDEECVRLSHPPETPRTTFFWFGISTIDAGGVVGSIDKSVQWDLLVSLNQRSRDTQGGLGLDLSRARVPIVCHAVPSLALSAVDRLRALFFRRKRPMCVHESSIRLSFARNLTQDGEGCRASCLTVMRKRRFVVPYNK